MTTLIKELTSTMLLLLDSQDKLNALKEQVAEEQGIGVWTYDHQGATWVLRITRKVQGRNGPVIKEVSLTKAKKL